jgi:GT2 family glycosyltransferase
MISKDFVKVACSSMKGYADKSILTGPVLEYGKLYSPSNPTFLGHFGKPPRKRLENINLSCNVFPRSAFTIACFDERISYGYEDTDLCAALLHNGYEIHFLKELLNEHAPPVRDSAQQISFKRTSERARFYTTIKRHLLWKKNYLNLLLFVSLALPHRLLGSARRQDWGDLKYCLPDMISSISLAWAERNKYARSSKDSTDFG